MTWCSRRPRRPGWPARAPPLPDPWPAEARDLFVRLLAAGPGLLGVWETLDETGALERILPEWERVRLLPHASVVHRFTVDRHLVETCIEASTLIRRVARPDVLMVAALLHDIGKGQLTEHCVAGEPIAREIARRMGFDEREVELVGDLVRWHLLLPETATTRDPDDPATVEVVTAKVARPRGARAAGRADRGRRQGHLGEGVDQVAGLAGAHAGTPRRGRARRRARTATTATAEIEIPERVLDDHAAGLGGGALVGRRFAGHGRLR